MYKYGFTSDIETETIPRGLYEEVVRLISAKKGEPEWMTERRAGGLPPLADDGAADVGAPRRSRRSISRTSSIMPRPRPEGSVGSMDEVDPELQDARSTSWASRSRSRWRWRAWPSMP